MVERKRYMDNRPIGVFDSGLGGLTVLKAIMDVLPGESVVYFGDNGRAPYGTKSKETVVKFTFQDIRFLLNQDIKMVVIACNTASASSFDQVRANFDIPVVEVIKPGASAAVKATRNGRIGVIGTSATINSGAYERAIKSINGDVFVYQKACPLLVPIVEEGKEWWDCDITEKIINRYLEEILQYDIDTLVLGCTHYPLLYELISKVAGPKVTLVSSAEEAAKETVGIINQYNMKRDSNLAPVYRYYTSDSVEKFEPLCSSILGCEIAIAEKVDIEKY